jgi:hypothetical protein
VAPESRGLLDQPAKILVKFGCASSNIDSRYIGLRQGTDTEFGCLAAHALLAIRPGIDMAMSACLVAQLSDVDLKHRDTGRAERSEAFSSQPFFKRGTCPNFI